jgi:hypothetical protein
MGQEDTQDRESHVSIDKWTSTGIAIGSSHSETSGELPPQWHAYAKYGWIVSVD